MSILKRITKKYMSLRFFNKKATKLSILGASLIGLCLSSGYSFAKYRDENYAGGSAGLATLGDIVVTYTDGTIVTTNQLPKQGTTADTGWHAFIATIKVQFFNVEVNQKFSMTFRLGSESSNEYKNASAPSKTSFALPNNETESKVSNISTYAKKNANSDIEKMTISTAKQYSYTKWDKFKVDTVAKNKGYFSVEKTNDESSISNDFSFSTWNTIDFAADNSNKTQFSTSYYSVDSQKSTTIFFFKILYFVDFELNSTTKEIIAEEAKMFYQIEGEQVA